MPLNNPSDHALGNEQNPYCAHCADESGNLKSKEEVREGMINFYTQTEGKTREDAERVVDAHMAMQPAWQQNSQTLPQTPVEPAEPVMTPQPSVEPVVPEPVASEPVLPEPVVSEPVAPVMPSTPVVEETAPEVPSVGQGESLPTPEPVTEVTNEAVNSTDSVVDNSGTNEA
jgi:hypothetical protein